MAERARTTIEVVAAPGGWPAPWPNVGELARVLPSSSWSLIGGLMTQLHVVHRGLDAVRPTNDVDIVLHVETVRGLPNAAATALESIGYELQPSIDARNDIAHRFVRGASVVDVVDVVAADHAAPSTLESIRRRRMMQIDGGTQALRRTINARVEIVPGETTVLSVPGPFGALILKAAAFQTDSRDRDRHLYDAVALLACIEDPYLERDGFQGSDRRRVQLLARTLTDDHAAWISLDTGARTEAQAALRLLSAAV